MSSYKPRTSPLTNTEAPIPGRSGARTSEPLPSGRSGARTSETPPPSRSGGRKRPTRGRRLETEEGVASETDCVFRSFVYHLYVREVFTPEGDSVRSEGVVGEEGRTVRDWPSLPQIREYGDEREDAVLDNTSLSAVGRQLALIADEINDRYSSEFSRLVDSLKISSTDSSTSMSTSYDLFADVARQLFSDGAVSWGRVVSVFCFAYRAAANMIVLRRHLANTIFPNVRRYLVRFVLVEKIAKWISEQGGWRTVLNYVPESWTSWRSFTVVCAASALSIITVIYITRSSQ